MPTITYTPSPGFIGLDSFTYQVTNDDGSTSQATVTVDVELNSFSVVDDLLEVQVGQPIDYQLSLNDELSGLGATYGVVGSLPDGMSVSSDGRVTGLLEFESTGSVGITVTLPNGSSGGSTFSWLARLPVEPDPWMAPIYVPDAQDTDADRVARALSDIRGWINDFPVTAASLKEQGDDYRDGV